MRTEQIVGVGIQEASEHIAGDAMGEVVFASQLGFGFDSVSLGQALALAQE